MSISNQDIVHMMQQKGRYFTKMLNAALQPYDLFMSQWSILYCIEKYGAMTQKEIWSYLHVEPPTVTRTLARMEKSGWIVREEGADKRERIIKLTDKSKRKFPQINASVKRVEQDYLSDITELEKKQLYQILQKVGSKEKE